jgi:molecular chaperone HtpG
MQALFKAMGQAGMENTKPILEINPTHPIITRMTAMSDGESFNDACLVLVDQALLVEGMPIENPAAFVKRLNVLMEKAL